MPPPRKRSSDEAAGEGTNADAENGRPAKAQRRQTDRSASENQERAYVAASRRSDRSLEARVTSARAASEVHQKRTGKALKIDEGIVLREEMYEEEDNDFFPLSKRVLGPAQSTPTTPAFNNKMDRWLVGKDSILPYATNGNTNCNAMGSCNKENIDTLFHQTFPDAAKHLEEMKQVPLFPQYPGQWTGQAAPQAAPQAAFQAPQAAPQVAFQAPQAAPQTAPQAALQAPQGAPQAASQVPPRAAPSAAPQAPQAAFQAAFPTGFQAAPRAAPQAAPQAAFEPVAHNDAQWIRFPYRIREPSMDFLRDIGIGTIPSLIPDSNAVLGQQSTPTVSPVSTPIVSSMNTPVNTPLLTPTTVWLNDPIIAGVRVPLNASMHNMISQIPEQQFDCVEDTGFNWDDFVYADMLG